MRPIEEIAKEQTSPLTMAKLEAVLWFQEREASSGRLEKRVGSFNVGKSVKQLQRSLIGGRQ